MASDSSARDGIKNKDTTGPASANPKNAQGEPKLRARASEALAASGEVVHFPRDVHECLTPAGRANFLRIVEASTLIKRHEGLYQWLQREIQDFIPHEVLISAYGYIDTWQLKLDVVSSVPGVRTQLLEHCDIDDVLEQAFKRWVDGGRRTYVLHTPEALRMKDGGCRCALHTALRNAQSTLVLGVHDERSGSDSLFIALNSRPVADGCFSGCLTEGPCFVLDSLITQMDVAFRKVATLPGAATTPTALRNGSDFGISEREREILDWVCKGKTNFETGVILNISTFTVKNHLQRIFQKIGASNRAQAVTIYAEKLKTLTNDWRK